MSVARLLRRPLLLISCVVAVVVLAYALIAVFSRSKPCRITKCRMNIEIVGKLLMLYADDHGGVFPPYGWDSKHAMPTWVYDTHLWCLRHKTRDDILTFVKCPSDTSDEVTSYEMNPALACLRFDQIPKSRRSRTIVVYEKCYPGSHGWAFYMDCHVDRLCRP